MKKYFVPNKQRSLLAFLGKKYFLGNPVRFRQGFEGQGISERGCYILGTQAGPKDFQDVSNLLHEMCHLAEREVEKIIEKPVSGWGFYHGKFWQIGNSWGFEPQNDKGLLREARVWSFQLSLSRHLGFEESAENLVRSSVFLTDFCFWRFKHSTEKESLFKLAEKVEKESKTYSFELFESKWFERMELLKI